MRLLILLMLLAGCGTAPQSLYISSDRPEACDDILSWSPDSNQTLFVYGSYISYMFSSSGIYTLTNNSDLQQQITGSYLALLPYCSVLIENGKVVSVQ